MENRAAPAPRIKLSLPLPHSNRSSGGVPPSLLPAQLNPAAPGAAFPSVTLGGGAGMSDSLCERRALRSRDAARREELRERRGALLLHCSPLLHANEQ